MGPDLWMQGAVVGLALAQLLVFWVLYRRSEVLGFTTDGRPATPGGKTATSDEERAVVCPDCGSANEPGFQYCQNCVSELPGTASSPDANDTPQGRGLS
ncbi:hypothetical protein ACFR9U_11300 [Halorientalis brevis]|uniref:DUF7577 domain-containing protein n=1 Tax=Halorientalis brevis TaxID=1126241 RepID=A0ABD6CDS5_9EURY|nr:zinc ribbon domain-containing protein [Halorientalis brevis]